MSLRNGLDLKTGKLYWLDTLLSPPEYPQLEEDLQCDVLIVGGGEAGALCAHYLSQFQLDVVLVERRKIGLGSTCANTGLLQFTNDKSLTACIHTFGESNGVRYYKLCEQALHELQEIASTLEVNPDFIRRDSMYFASSDQDLLALQQEYLLLKRHGFQVSYLKREELESMYSFSKAGAIYSKGDAEVNPYKLANFLVHKCWKKGLRVYQRTEVITHSFDQHQLIFTTKNRKRITAQKAIIASGYETQQQFKHNPNASMSSSFAIATQPVDEITGWHNRSLIWETARPYLFIRTTADNRIIAGGMDETTFEPEKRNAMLLHKRDLLLQEIHKLFPHIPNLRADYYWAGTFGTTHDGYPLIGLQPEFPNCYFALGYGGNGTVNATIAAQIVTSLVTKGSHPDADLFRFNREPYMTTVSG